MLKLYRFYYCIIRTGVYNIVKEVMTWNITNLKEKQQYLPDNIKNKVYYEYGDNKMEKTTKEYWNRIKGK